VQEENRKHILVSQVGANEDEAPEQENMSTSNRNMYRCTLAMHMFGHERNNRILHIFRHTHYI